MTSPNSRGTFPFSCVDYLVSKHGPLGNSPHAPSIHILDENSLLNIFYLYRPAIFDVDEDDDDRILGGKGWERERWWYKLAQVCQRWRILILGSASYLGLCLVCTYGTPVADMLAHSPTLPLVIDYFQEDEDITGEEEGVVVALEQRDRVRRVRLAVPLPNLEKLIMAIDGEYPVLEYLIMGQSADDSTALMLPGFQAPHLRHLMLLGFALPIRSRLLTTAVGLITLCLYMDTSTYSRPSTLLQWISLMPQLETLNIAPLSPVPNLDVERQLMYTPITTHVTLPNLRSFAFQGGSAYLEAFVSRITTPLLEQFSIEFYEQLTFSVPRLAQFMSTTEHLRFDSAKFVFSSTQVSVEFYPREAKTNTLSIYVYCCHFDWQVSSVAQISNSLSQIFSTVEHLILENKEHSQSSEEHNQVDRIEWRRLLTSFGTVKTLRVEDGLVKELSRCLRLDDEEHSLELLPELQELTYSGSGDRDAGDAFTSFVDTRQNAGHPVTLVRSSPNV